MLVDGIVNLLPQANRCLPNLQCSACQKTSQPLQKQSVLCSASLNLFLCFPLGEPNCKTIFPFEYVHMIWGVFVLLSKGPQTRNSFYVAQNIPLRAPNQVP